MPLYSVVIPARNEEANITYTVDGIVQEFARHNIDFEVIVVNDGSADRTRQVIEEMSQTDKRVRVVDNQKPFGFGNAIKKGLKHFRGDYVIVAMADSSDDPRDMLGYIRETQKGFDCCFGSRWAKEARVEGYPLLKLILNRLVNWGISVVFGLKYKDVTNAFKCYSRETIRGISPILSHHFNITVEMPLKAIVRGYTYTIISTHWRERRRGKTSLKLQEMGSRYLFIILYVLLEKWLCGSDYKRSEMLPSSVNS